MPDQTEKQNDPLWTIRRPLINSSNAQTHRLTFLDALNQAAETCRTVAGWAASPRELRELASFRPRPVHRTTLQSPDEPPARHVSDALCRRELAETGI